MNSNNTFSTLNSTSDEEDNLVLLPTKDNKRGLVKQVKSKKKKKSRGVAIDLASLMSDTKSSLPSAPSSVCGSETSSYVKRDFTPTPKRDLTNTRMCSSFIRKSKCPHGDKCRFAHSYEELNPSPCNFDGRCRNATTCKFKHSNETNETYVERLASLDKKPRASGMKMTRFVERPKTASVSGFYLVGEAKVLKTPTPKEPKEVVLRVPKDLVLDSVSALLAKGETKFRIVIV